MAIAVRRYPFPAPEWCRTIWTSPKAREVWEPRIQSVSRAWEATELASVGVVRSCALQACSPDQLPELSARAIHRGLVCLPLQQQGSNGSYQSGSVALSQAKTWNYRIVVANSLDAARAFSTAWQDGDNDMIGALLGFPRCCREFFNRVWVADTRLDTTWGMVESDASDHTVNVSGPVEANILGRWIGCRWVPHLPCSFDCQASASFGRRMRSVMQDGYGQEAAWLDEILSWPMEWSGWHGCGELKIPILKVSFKTDATAELIRIRREGTSYPAEGAQGLKFPYRRHAPASTVISLSSLCKPKTEDVWTDNGFSSKAAMDAAHKQILEAITPCSGPVLDLGAGNGELLQKIGVGVGVEMDDARASRGRAKRRDIRTGLIQNLANVIREDEEFSIAIISQRRREEMTAEENAVLDILLRGHCQHLLTYSYDSPVFQKLERL